MGDNREILTFRQKLSEEQEKGHRERLRQRFLSAGIKGFLDYELLELLLTYTVIRKNCRGIAKNLLEKYGDLYTILRQSEEELHKNKYMTQRTVVFLKLLFEIIENELVKEEELFYGTIDKSTVYIRELIKKILEYNAKGVILVHNHPAGSLKPSESDIILTKKVKEVFENMEIRLVDHLIISEKGYFSFLEGGIL